MLTVHQCKNKSFTLFTKCNWNMRTNEQMQSVRTWIVLHIRNRQKHQSRHFPACFAKLNTVSYLHITTKKKLIKSRTNLSLTSCVCTEHKHTYCEMSNPLFNVISCERSWICRRTLNPGGRTNNWPTTAFEVMIYALANTILCSIQSTSGW